MIIDASSLLAFAKKIQVSHSTEEIGVSQKFNFLNFIVCLLSPHRKKKRKMKLAGKTSLFSTLQNGLTLRKNKIVQILVLHTFYHHTAFFKFYQFSHFYLFDIGECLNFPINV